MTFRRILRATLRHRFKIVAGGVTALVAIGAWLLFDLRFQFGTGPVAITVDSPSVHTRERLLNDRFEQVAWITDQLDLTRRITPPDPRSKGAGAEKSEKVASSERTDTKPTGATEGSPLRVQVTREERVDIVYGSDDDPRRWFDRLNGYRDVLRGERARAMLDDRHDMDGNTLYLLSFDTTVMSGSKSHGAAAVEAVVTREPGDLPMLRDIPGGLGALARLKEFELQDLFDIYVNWLENIRKSQREGARLIAELLGRHPPAIPEELGMLLPMLEVAVCAELVAANSTGVRGSPAPGPEQRRAACESVMHIGATRRDHREPAEPFIALARIAARDVATITEAAETYFKKHNEKAYRASTVPNLRTLAADMDSIGGKLDLKISDHGILDRAILARKKVEKYSDLADSDLIEHVFGTYDEAVRRCLVAESQGSNVIRIRDSRLYELLNERLPKDPSLKENARRPRWRWQGETGMQATSGPGGSPAMPRSSPLITPSSPPTRYAFPQTSEGEFREELRIACPLDYRPGDRAQVLYAVMATLLRSSAALPNAAPVATVRERSAPDSEAVKDEWITARIEGPPTEIKIATRDLAVPYSCIGAMWIQERAATARADLPRNHGASLSEFFDVRVEKLQDGQCVIVTDPKVFSLGEWSHQPSPLGRLESALTMEPPPNQTRSDKQIFVDDVKPFMDSWNLGEKVSVSDANRIYVTVDGALHTLVEAERLTVGMFSDAGRLTFRETVAVERREPGLKVRRTSGAVGARIMGGPRAVISVDDVRPFESEWKFGKNERVSPKNPVEVTFDDKTLGDKKMRVIRVDRKAMPEMPDAGRLILDATEDLDAISKVRLVHRSKFPRDVANVLTASHELEIDVDNVLPFSSRKLNNADHGVGHHNPLFVVVGRERGRPYQRFSVVKSEPSDQTNEGKQAGVVRLVGAAKGKLAWKDEEIRIDGGADLLRKLSILLEGPGYSERGATAVTQAFSYGLTPRLRQYYAVRSSRASGGAYRSGEDAASITQTARLEAERTEPEVVGFNRPRVHDGKAKRGAQFGWVVMPKPDGKAELEWVLPVEQVQLGALVAMPSWWRSALVQVCTRFVEQPKLGNVATASFWDQAVRSKQCRIEVVRLPGTAIDLSRHLGMDVITYPHAEPEDQAPVLYAADRTKPATILIKGQRLWRSTVVTLGGQVADKIQVLPDMTGIIARFECVDVPTARARAIRNAVPWERNPAYQYWNVPLVVWTSEGHTDDLGAIVAVPIAAHSTTRSERDAASCNGGAGGSASTR